MEHIVSKQTICHVEICNRRTTPVSKRTFMRDSTTYDVTWRPQI